MFLDVPHLSGNMTRFQPIRYNLQSQAQSSVAARDPNKRPTSRTLKVITDLFQRPRACREPGHGSMANRIARTEECAIHYHGELLPSHQFMRPHALVQRASFLKVLSASSTDQIEKQRDMEYVSQFSDTYLHDSTTISRMLKNFSTKGCSGTLR